MALPRSTFYDAPSLVVDTAEIVGRMQTTLSATLLRRHLRKLRA